MRIQELLSTTTLSEVRMGPANLRAQAAKIDARVGMEFEMYVPDVEGVEREPDWEPDYGPDGYISTDSWAAFSDDVIDFFTSGEFADHSRDHMQRIVDQANEDFIQWAMSEWRTWAEDGAFSEWWAKENPDDSEPRMGSIGYERAMEEFQEESFQDWMEEGNRINEWLEGERIDRYSTFGSYYNLAWPHMSDPGPSSGSQDLETLAQDFQRAVGVPVQVSGEYHGRAKSESAYTIEPDGSLDKPHSSSDAGLEFVSPPLTIPEMIDQLRKVIKWARFNGCYTNASTGLHINVSIPGYDLNKLDYVKLALFVGDEWVSGQFNRLGSVYAKSAMGDIRSRIRMMAPDTISKIPSLFIGKGLSGIASKLIHGARTEKYMSLNTNDNRVEFRAPGGDWLESDIDQLINTMLRFVVALDIAMDPEKEKREYAIKLYKLISQNASREDLDTLQYFAQYSAGTLPKAALKSWVRNIQQKRTGDEKKPPTKAEPENLDWVNRLRTHLEPPTNTGQPD